MVVNDSSFRQERGFCILYQDKYHHKWGWAKQKQNREKQATVIKGGGLEYTYCVYLLCNIWPHACMFYVDSHIDNHGFHTDNSLNINRNMQKNNVAGLQTGLNTFYILYSEQYLNLD